MAVVYSPRLGELHATHCPASLLNWLRIITSDMYKMRERGLTQGLAAVVNSTFPCSYVPLLSDIVSVGHWSRRTSGWVDK